MHSLDLPTASTHKWDTPQRQDSRGPCGSCSAPALRMSGCTNKMWDYMDYMDYIYGLYIINYNGLYGLITWDV